MSAPSERRFAFVQWEFPGRLGPEPGRYPVRRYAGDDVRQVLVIGGLLPRRRARAGRRPRRAAPGGEAVDVEVTRATVIDAQPLADRDAAEAWLARAVGADAERVVGDALALLNRAVAGHRVAAADPYLADADPARAIVTRVGYGSGEQVADGEWEAARELPPPRPGRRRALLAPQERMAAVLSGRDAALACEELVLRARADLDHGREREAALQLDVALRVALAELEGWRGQGDMGERLDELAALSSGVAAAAEAALAGGLAPGAVEAIGGALARVEAVLRARAVISAGS